MNVYIRPTIRKDLIKTLEFIFLVFSFMWYSLFFRCTLVQFYYNCKGLVISSSSFCSGIEQILSQLIYYKGKHYYYYFYYRLFFMDALRNCLIYCFSSDLEGVFERFSACLEASESNFRVKGHQTVLILHGVESQYLQR